MDYSVAAQTYVKLALHAAKRPANAVCGLLLGQEQGQGFSISDAVPLFHHEAPLGPLLEVACAMVDAHCQKSQKLQIVGFYYAGSGYSPSESGSGLSHFAEKVADRVEANCSRACVLLLDGQQLGTEAKTGLQFLLKDVKRGWTKVDKRLKVVDGAAKTLTQGLQQNVQKDVVDFEEHLEDVSKDWRNPHVVELLKLNV
ncbi:ER membrane protein complex subunit 9 [Phytophthora pseudosyringae]|uniref:ER membrane protein complex subunit 9 n=1 Tax=Phytophthora pseudosyringae TaxID=221518 RepID=A0A8T1W0R2_9STRA|nr:ER membrane protein complex subunit 9 [Phytophthora pseudosyringae]